MTKPALVLLPGLLCDESVWAFQIERIKSYADVIVPKLDRYDSVDLMIDYILSVSPSSFMLAGHSMGGWLALELMRNHSNRVTKLCVLASSAALDKPGKKRLREQSIKLYSKKSAHCLAEQFTKRYVYKPEITQQVVEMFERNMRDFVFQQQVLLHRTSCLDVLPTITVPTTVVVGKNDSEFYAQSIEMANKIKDARLISVDDCGHMLMLEQPQACSDILLHFLEVTV